MCPSLRMLFLYFQNRIPLRSNSLVATFARELYLTQWRLTERMKEFSVELELHLNLIYLRSRKAFLFFLFQLRRNLSFLKISLTIV